jgi:hypothetical protein
VRNIVSNTSRSLSVACLLNSPTRPAMAATPKGLMSAVDVVVLNSPPRTAK